MRLVILKDLKITEDEINELERQITDLYFEHAGIEPEFYVEEHNFSYYPTYIDSDGDIRPGTQWLKDTTDTVYKRYGQWGTDHVIFLIHEDNWKSDTDDIKGIWGTSYSNIHHSYHVQYVRFDRDNMANSVGTFYHEIMHSHDNLIKTTLGIDIEKLLGFDWDAKVVHGGGPNYKYIRHKENTSALAYISSFLKKAYDKRSDLHQKNLGLMKTIIQLLQKIVVLTRAGYNKKDGVPR